MTVNICSGSSFPSTSDWLVVKKKVADLLYTAAPKSIWTFKMHLKSMNIFELRNKLLHQVTFIIAQTHIEIKYFTKTLVRK